MATWQDIITAAQTLLQRWKRDVDFTSQIVNGPATGPTSVVNTDGGTIPTFSKTLNDFGISGFPGRLADPNDTSQGDALVAVKQPFTGAVARTQHDKNLVSIDVMDFMSDTQKSDVRARTALIDISDAFQAALTYANTVGGAEIYFPPGIYRKSDLSPTLQLTGNVKIRGAGIGVTVILHEDLPANPRMDMLNINSGAYATFSDLTINGTLLANMTQTNQSQGIVGDSAAVVIVERVRFQNLRFMAVAITNVKRFFASHCEMESILRDGFHLPDCEGATITDSDFKNVGDDAIGIHSSDGGTGVLPYGHVITGNRFEQCQSVKILGAKVANVSDNVFRRAVRGCIYISNNDANDTTEGNTPIFVIKVCNNVIVDPLSAFSRDWAIRVNLRPLTKGALSSQPGFVSAPYAYNYGRNIDAAGGINPGAFGIDVSGNIISRTLNSGQTFADYGFSPILDRATVTFINYSIVSTSFDVDGIYLSGATQNFAVLNNKISGLGIGRSAIRLDDLGAAQNMRGGIVGNNSVHDCPGIGLLFGSSSSAVTNVDVSNNKFDLDPFFRSSAHNADNTWTNSTSVIGVSLNVKNGGQMYGNTFHNLGNPVSGDTTLIYMGPNYVFGSLAVAGDDATNKGVRFINVLLNHIFVQYEADPTNANYGLIGTVPMSMSSAMPSTGYYVRGHVVRKHTPTVAGAGGSQYTVTGWWRNTTGSAHVANTDWLEMRQLTGT